MKKLKTSTIILFLFSCFFINQLFAQPINSNTNPKFLIVYKVIGDSPAEKAGIKTYDIIYSLNNKVFYEINSPQLAQDFGTFIHTLPMGQYELIVLRSGQKVKLTVELPEKAQSGRLGILLAAIENDPQIYFDQGIQRLNTSKTRKDLKEVAKYFETAKALSPEWEDVYYNLGLIYDKLDYYDKAVENLVEHLRLLIRRKATFEETEKTAILLGRAKKNKEKLNDIKNKMVNGKWNLKKKIPASVFVESFYPKFMLTSDGKMWMQNKAKKELVTLKRMNDPFSDKYIYVYEKTLQNYPWFEVVWDGRIFEVRQFSIAIGEKTKKPGILFFSSLFFLFKGEINFDTQPMFIKVFEYSHWGKTESENLDEAIKMSSQELKDFKFDEKKDFSREIHYELE